MISDGRGLCVLLYRFEEGAIVANIDSYLSTEEIGRIVSFLGYGRLSAPVWFLGFEEDLGKMDSEDALRNLKGRGSFEDVMDLHEAHLRLWERGQPIDIEKNPPSTQVWQFMAKIMRACDRHDDWRDLNLAKKYIRFKLGRRESDTFLTELSPIPAGDAKDTKWMTMFKSLDPELDSKIKDRRRDLQRILKENAPPLVICYGITKADAFAELLNVNWRSVCTGVYASLDSRRLLLPFFGNGQMGHAVIEELLKRGLLRSGYCSLDPTNLSSVS